jgi:hypothetical protein
MFSIHITKLMNFSLFYVLHIQEMDCRQNFTRGRILYFLKHYKHTTQCVNSVWMSANYIHSCHRINKLGTHAHHCDHSAAAAVFTNRTYFMDNPCTL